MLPIVLLELFRSSQAVMRSGGKRIRLLCRCRIWYTNHTAQDHFSLTAEENAVDYLRQAWCFLLRTDVDSVAWKWVTIALHGALYGFAVVACRGTTNDAVAPGGRLVSFPEAMKLCQEKTTMERYTHSKTLTLTEEQKKSVNLMQKQFRNNLEHLTPGIWTFLLEGYPKACLDVLEIIRFLVIESGNVILAQPGQSDEFSRLHEDLVAKLKALSVAT